MKLKCRCGRDAVWAGLTHALDNDDQVIDKDECWCNACMRFVSLLAEVIGYAAKALPCPEGLRPGEAHPDLFTLLHDVETAWFIAYAVDEATRQALKREAQYEKWARENPQEALLRFLLEDEDETN